MRRALGWLTGVVGVAALARILHRRQHSAGATPPTADPAEKLRETLARTRDEDPTPAAADPEPVATPEERRAQVHERAQETIERMQATGGETE